MKNIRVGKQELVWKRLQETLKDTEESENDHFSKDALLASQAWGWGWEGEGAGMQERQPLLSPKQRQRIFSGAKRAKATRLLLDRPCPSAPVPQIHLRPGLCSHKNVLSCRFIHAWGKKQTPLRSIHSESSTDQSQSLRGKDQGGPGCPASEAPLPPRCQVSGGLSASMKCGNLKGSESTDSGSRGPGN